MKKPVLNILTENFADAEYSSCSAEAWPKVNVDVSVVYEGVVRR